MILVTKLSFTLAALSLAAATPVFAGTLAAGGSTVYGSAASSFFQPAYGADGFIEFDTTVAGQTAGHFVFSGPLFTAAPTATTITAQPAYLSGFTGFNVDHATGYGYPNISTGKQAGQVGYGVGDGGGNIFSFTVGSAKSFTLGILSNYSTNLLESPTVLTVTGSGSAPVSVFNPGSAASFATIYKYSITDAAPGETYTVSTNQGYISGVTFDSAPAVPEASTAVGFGLPLVLGGLVLAARRRKTA